MGMNVYRNSKFSPQKTRKEMSTLKRKESPVATQEENDGTKQAKPTNMMQRVMEAVSDAKYTSGLDEAVACEMAGLLCTLLAMKERKRGGTWTDFTTDAVLNDSLGRMDHLKDAAKRDDMDPFTQLLALALELLEHEEKDHLRDTKMHILWMHILNCLRGAANETRVKTYYAQYTKWSKGKRIRVTKGHESTMQTL